MASKILHEAQRGASCGSIDLPLAAVAGLAVGFVAFMLPADILARLVEMGRLPEFLPAAAPPLGAKARIALAAAASGTTLGAVYFLLRLLGRKDPEPKPQIWPEMDTEREQETPRLRRSDVHPDAPARRPILATRELGEPDPAPIWGRKSAPAELEAATAPPQEEPLELGGPGTEMLEAEPEAAVVAEPVFAEPVFDEPVVERPSIDEPLIEEPAHPTAQAIVVEPVGDASIAELMARLEQGIARRARQVPAAPSPPERAAVPAAAAAPPAPSAEWGDDRLRSAIENLQKMAARAS